MKLVSKILEVNTSFNKPVASHRTKPTPKRSLEIGVIQKEWPKIVGDGFLLKHTVPIRIEKSELYIATNHSSILEQSSFVKKILNQKLGQDSKNSFFKIKNVNFVFNIKLFTQQKSFIEKTFSQKKREPYFHPFSPKYKLLKKRAEKEFQFLEDPDLKMKLVSLFIQKSCHEKGSGPN